jgi:hypothetical protein
MAGSNRPRLKALHPDSALNPVKLAQMERLSTDVLRDSLLPGQAACLKTRPDGTVLDGHHRLFVLRGRGIDIEILEREIIEKAGDASETS